MWLFIFLAELDHKIDTTHVYEYAVDLQQADIS